VIGVDFVSARLPELLIRTREHLFLTGVATGAAVLAGIPIGILITRKVWLRTLVFSLAGIVQTVPSLAMLAFLLAIIGKIGVLPAIIALALYAFLPIIRNTVTGLEGVPYEILEAAEGMGMTPLQQMRTVKLPLAMPVIVAGVKTAAVISVGIATLSAFIGAGGLGEFIIRGLSLADTRLIMLGAVPSAMLALYVSFSIAAVEWGLNKRERRGMPLLSGRAGMALSFAPLAILALLGVAGELLKVTPQAETTVRIGSKNFTEQLILGEIMAQRIEGATDLEVVRRFNLGGTMICHEALLEGEIDLYPEYTGTALIAILGREERPTDPEEVFRLVSGVYEESFGLGWLGPFGFNNTYAIAVRDEAAERRGWRKISDLAEEARGLKAGFTAEFSERPDGYPGLRKAYGFEFGQVLNLDPALMYEAVKRGEVDLITAFSTDSRIPGYDLVILEDDRRFFPPYFAAPVVREEALKAHPGIRRALAPLEGLLDEETMRKLNYSVDQDRRAVREVVREYLESEGLL
jgi:osmoprotectant transport system permease protein